METPPVTAVLLYDSGIAQYQHAGELRGNARIHLDFSVDDIDDALKSLVFADAGNGRARMLELRSAENDLPVAERLYERPLTLAQLLQSFRGHAVNAVAADNAFAGTIVGVETRTEGDKSFEVVVLLQENSLRWFRLSEMQSIEMLDTALQQRLAAALRRLTDTNARTTKGIDLLFEGEGARQVSFAYVLGAPVWRMSYRLVVEPDTVGLQGWAHVDNATSTPWNQVSLELRSGQPDSFQAPLLRPLYNPRPRLGMAVFGVDDSKAFFGGAPLADAGNELPRQSGVLEHARGFGGGGVMGGGGGGFAADVVQQEGIPAGAEGEMDLESAVHALSDPTIVAEMVRFRIDEPISLAAGQSAVIPVFQRPFAARRVSVLPVTVDAGHPVRTLQLTNGLDCTLVPGPVAMHEGGHFIGDALLPRTAVGEQATFRLGLDEFLTVTRNPPATHAQSRGIACIGGELVVTDSETTSTLLLVENRGSEPRTLRAANRLPVGSQHVAPAAIAIHPDSVEAEVTISGNSTSEIEFVATRKVERKFPLATVKLPALAEYLAQREGIAAGTEKILVEYQALLARQADLIEVVNQTVARRTALTAQQESLRKNIAAIGGENEGAQPFIEKLLAAEAELERVDQEIDAATQARDSGETAVQHFLDGLEKQ